MNNNSRKWGWMLKGLWKVRVSKFYGLNKKKEITNIFN